MTKQIIFGDDVSSATAFGIRCVNQAGTLLTTTPAAGVLFRFERLNAGGTVSEVKSPWIDAAWVSNANVTTGAAATAQTAAVTLVEDATTPDVGYFKIIDTSSGYEPFERKGYDIPVATMGGGVGAIAAFLAAAITADIAAGNLPWITTAVAVGAVLTLTGTTFTNGASGTSATNFQVAFDPGTSVATCTVPTLGAGSVGVGDVEVMMKLEGENLGSGVSDYDRATYLPDGTVTYASAGFPYELSTITWVNPTPNQINGVDNERVLILAVRNSAAAVAPATGTEPGTIVGGL